MKTRISTKEIKITDKLTIPAHVTTIEAEEPIVAIVQDLADRHDRGMKDCKDAYDSKHEEMLLHKERADAAEKALRDMASSMEEEDDENEENDPDDDDEELGENKKKAPKAKDIKAGDVAALAAAIGARIANRDARVKVLRERGSDKALEKRAEERSKVVADAKRILGEDFDAKGKTVAQIRVAGLDAALKDDGLKGVVAAVLGDTKPAEAKAEDAAKAFGAVIATGARSSATDTQDPDLSRVLVGDGAGTYSGPAQTARDGWMAREAARSRQPAGNRTYSRSAGDSDARVEDR